MFVELTPENEQKLEKKRKLERSRYFGLCVVVTNSKGQVTHYWAYDHLSTRLDTQDPQLFATRKALIWRRNALINEGFKAKLAVWFFDDSYMEPLEKYINLKSRFPGSPRL